MPPWPFPLLPLLPPVEVAVAAPLEVMGVVLCIVFGGELGVVLVAAGGLAVVLDVVCVVVT